MLQHHPPRQSHVTTVGGDNVHERYIQPVVVASMEELLVECGCLFRKVQHHEQESRHVLGPYCENGQ